MDAATHLLLVSLGGSVLLCGLSVTYLLVGVRYAKWLRRRGVAEPEQKAVALLKASRPNRLALYRMPADNDDKSLPPAA